jgi:hypothetical protein
MARSEPAGIGHNMSDADFDALVTARTHLIRQKQAVAAAKAAELKAARGEVAHSFKAFSPLGYTRGQVEELLRAQDMDDDEWLEEQAKMGRLFKAGGLAVPEGHQFDLVERLNDTADDQARAHALGYRAGVRGDDGTPPDTIHPACIQSWTAGWGEGQAKLAQSLARADEIEAELKQPAASDDEADEEGEGDEPEFDADKAARKVRQSGFMERSPEPVTA